ncbi:hypothetical protein N9F64_00455 [bacterium]|nr:hypothetical protein [bacterium]
MNQLTKFLVDGILNEGKGKVIAAYGGGFKPPTAGHFEVVKKTLEQNPEIDELTIFVGGGERDGLTQAEAILIWEVYQTYLPMKVNIQPSKAPIGDVIRLGKNNLQDTVYFVIGGRDGRDDDAEDIASRTKGIEEKYPNMKVKVVTTPDTGMSGTNARQAAKVSYEEFEKYLPGELSDEEKEMVYNIVSPAIKEIKLPTISDIKEKFKIFVNNLKQEGAETKAAFSLLFKAAKGEIELTDLDKQQIKEQLKDVLKGVFGVAILAIPAGSLVLLLLKLIKLHGLVTPTAFLEENDPEDGKAAPYGSGYNELKEGDYSPLGYAKRIINGDISFREAMEESGISFGNLSDLLKKLGAEHLIATSYNLDNLNENASYSKDIDIKEKIIQLTQHMLDKGYNIEPLPAVEFVDGDSDNAREFLGKTAYYNPENQTIVLYTEGRHPKDIVRSFSHEMVHHIQNLEGRLGNITTTNTQEDDNLNDIEAEANLKGTMTFRNWTDSLNEGINEYDNSGPTTPKVYIVKDDGTYKEAPIELLSKISNLTYDMGGGETNYYPEKNIVIVDNIPVEEFAKEPGDIKGEKVYVEYNLNNPTSLPKANKIIASQLVYHLDNREALAQTVANSLKDGGTFEFQSDLMNKKDKMFLQHLSDEYGFGLPTKLNQYKQESLPLKKGEFVEPLISYIYKITDKDDKTSTLSVTKKGKWWEYEKIDGDLDFKTGKFSTPPIDPDPDFRDKKYTLRTFDKYLSFFGDSNTIVDFEELNEANKPYKHKHGFDDKLGNDPFGLNQYARELAQGLEEAIVGDKIECDNCGWSWDIEDGGDDLYTCHKCWHDNTPKQLNEGRYDTLANKLSSIAFEAFKDIHDRGDKEGEFEFRVDHPDEEHDIPSKDFFFDFAGKVEITDDEYGVDGGANAGFDNEGDEITPLLSVKFKIPKNPDWQKVSFDIKDVVRHELEHLTQDGYNEKTGKYMEDDQLLRDLIDADMLSKSSYFRLEKEVDAMLQGLYFKAKKAKRPFKDVIDDYLNIFIDQETITQEEKENILDIWRSRGKALSLPLFEQMKDMDYEIYSDMDGVLTDFDASFMKASDGILPSEYEKNFGKDGFWKLIDERGVGYWVGMPWMPDGKTYWDYIKKYTPILLSSPSRSQTSRLGKRLWVRNNMPGTKLILAQAKDKQNYAQKNRILIDDRPSNIDQWRASGGIGILHTSASDTIRQLKELGL